MSQDNTNQETPKKSWELLKEHLESPEGKKMTEEWFAKLKEDHKKLKDNFESPEFNQIYDKMLSYLEAAPKDHIQDNDYDEPVIEGISNDEFRYWDETLSHVMRDKKKTDRRETFNNEYVYYKRFKVQTFHGQGSFTRVTLRKIKNV